MGHGSTQSYRPWVSGDLEPYAMVLHERLLVWNKNSKEILKHCLYPGILWRTRWDCCSLLALTCYFMSTVLIGKTFHVLCVGYFRVNMRNKSIKKSEVSYYWGVPYPFAFVNPIEIATTKAGNPSKETQEWWKATYWVILQSRRHSQHMYGSFSQRSRIRRN